MRIRQCDRCGKAYEPYLHKHNSITLGTYNMDNELETMEDNYDLCQECQEQVVTWLHNMDALPGQVQMEMSKVPVAHICD